MIKIYDDIDKHKVNINNNYLKCMHFKEKYLTFICDFKYDIFLFKYSSNIWFMAYVIDGIFIDLSV